MRKKLEYPPGGSKLITFLTANFFQSKILHALIQRGGGGGGKGPGPPWKNTSYMGFNRE